MTCIVGLKSKKTGKVYLGGDSATTKGAQRMIRAEPKVYKRGEILFGGAGNSVVSQVLSHIASDPSVVEKQDPLGYILNEFIPSFKKFLRQADQLREKDGVATVPNEFLVAFRGELFSISSDFDVFTSLDDYMAIGSGEEYALGSLYSTKYSDLKPEERLFMALEAASKHDSYVGGPLQVVDEDGNEWNR